MASSTVEDYLKQIFLCSQSPAPEMVSMGALASAMRVVPGTATAMVKTLSESGMVDYEPRGGVKLTRAGEKIAIHVLRRHRLVELFLVEVLKLDWAEVHDEAERLEHVISDKVLDRIDALLGHPEVDPHGDPIPTAAGKLVKSKPVSLLEAPVARRLKVARIVDQDAAFLQFVQQNRLTPGTAISIRARDPASDSLTLSISDKASLTLGSKAAAKILVDVS